MFSPGSFASINSADLFLWTGIISTVLFVVKLILFFITGGLSELNFDFDTVAETDGSFNFLTVESLMLLFMGFGWIGYSCYAAKHYSFSVSVFWGIFAGLVFSFLYAYLLMCIKRLDETPVVKKEDYINAQGKAYSRIPAHNKGQAELTINNQLKVIEVFNGSDEDIESFAPIKVFNIEDGEVYIEKVQSSSEDNGD